MSCFSLKKILIQIIYTCNINIIYIELMRALILNLKLNSNLTKLSKMFQ